MNHRTETEGTLVPLRYLRLVGITLLPENHHDDNGCAGHQQDADDTECHSAGIAGLRQIKTAGIDDFQRNDGICTAVIVQHVDILAVDSGGCGQQVVLQMGLRHILEVAGVFDNGCIPGIVLNQPQQVGGVDVTQFRGFDLRNDDFDVVLEQRIAIIGSDFSYSISIVLQSLDNDQPLTVSVLDGNEVRSVFLVGYMADHIVDTLVFVQLRLDIVLIGIILHDEFNVGIVALGVGEELYQLYGIGENVRIVNQRVVVILGGTLPKHDDLVGITGIAVNNGIIRVHGSLVSDTVQSE